MRTMRLIPAGPPNAPATTRRRGLWLCISALAHVLALLAVLLLTRRPEPQEQAAPSYDLVFEGNGSNVPSTSPERGDAQPPSQPSPESMAAPPVPATPSAPDSTPPPATAPPMPEPAPQGPATPMPTAPVPDTPPPPDAPPAQADAAVRLDLPPPPPVAPPLVPDLALPQPPPVPAPPAPRPRPAPPRPRTAPPPGSFANPMDLSFNQTPRQGERLAAPRIGAAPGSVASRSMDLSVGTQRAGANRSSAFFDARARNLGADWMQGVQQYWLRHRYYPRQAAESGEDGSVDLELTVSKTGRVQSAVLKSHSGSSWIDMAAVSTFRSAQLPPLPEEVGDPYTVTITINYILIR